MKVRHVTTGHSDDSKAVFAADEEVDPVAWSAMTDPPPLR